ncbi:MAG: HAMP domain-containing histidine kinase [Lachnospiraceae bacterium]|nr:HAMP domain-containing histidine kinase [Lachnospiraceae bacterium]
MEKTKGKYMISLRTYFSIGAIITLCLSCLVSSALVLIPTVLFYHGEISLKLMVMICLAVCSLTMVIGGAALYLGSVYFVRPLEEMGKVVQKISKGDFDVRVDRGANRVKNAEYMHELDELEANINLMAEELSGMDHMRKDFVSNVSHEMKTPVSSMMGFAEMLLEDDLSEEEEKEYLLMIYDESKRASNLCENMLKMSRLENQAMVTKHEDVRVDEQIRRSIIVVSEKYSGREIEFDVDLAPMQIKTDPDLLNQVWINIIDNAVKYSGTGKRIHVFGENIEKGIFVAVEDEGIGIPLEKQKHIFDAFYQCEESHKGEGNGLGLSIVKRILELINGEIECVSDGSSGTKMIIKVYEK